MDYLMHYNKNHDPKTGRFAPSKDNKYQLRSGYLTPAGKQRWAQQYMADLREAQKRVVILLIYRRRLNLKNG